MPEVYAVIMAGGAGTRFWPASRERRPKQLLPLAGDRNEALLSATVRRLHPLIPPERVYIATGEHLLDATAIAVPNVPRSQLLAEPIPRNTAPCIGWATSTIRRRDPEAILAVLPSDHFIADEEGFRNVLSNALESARQGYLTTIGIVPTRPETGYGYIEVGDPVSTSARAVKRFVEKPDKARAQTYVDGGQHLWNAGMFFFRAQTMMDSIEQHLPALASGLAKLDESAKQGNESQALRSIFPELPSISIDHGIMEKASRLAVVPGSFGWNDVGSWQSTWELAPHDDKGNALSSNSLAIDSRGNLVCDLTQNDRKKKVIALVGVSDLVVVETDDALLVIPRERAQDVRAVVDALKARGERSPLV